MKKFQFRLAPIQRLRAHDVELRQADLARELQELGRLTDGKTALIEEMRTLEERFAAHPNLYATTAAAFGYAQQRLVQQEQLIAQQMTRVEQAQVALAEAQKRRKMLDKLEERARETFNAAFLRDEQAQIDEIATMRFAR